MRLGDQGHQRSRIDSHRKVWEAAARLPVALPAAELGERDALADSVRAHQVLDVPVGAYIRGRGEPHCGDIMPLRRHPHRVPGGQGPHAPIDRIQFQDATLHIRN